MDYTIQSIILLSLATLTIGNSHSLRVKSDSPVIRGGTVNFIAEYYDENELSSGSFEYEWFDNVNPQHTRKVDSKDPIDHFAAQYSADIKPGIYSMTVIAVKYYTIIPIPYSKVTTIYHFNITEFLNGELEILQQNKSITDEFVSSLDTAKIQVNLSGADYNLVNTSATSIHTYWFVDCLFYEITQNFTIDFNFTVPNKEHVISAVSLIGYEPITTPAPPTTTELPTTTQAPNVTTTSTTIAPNVTTTTTTTTISPVANNTNRDISVKSIAKRAANGTEVPKNGTNTGVFAVTQISPLITHGVKPFPGNFRYECDRNVLKLAGDLKNENSYGYFNRKVVIKEPVRNITVSGNNWLQGGDVLSLLVTCDGSANFNYCVHFYDGVYNVTGDEACVQPDITEKCRFYISRYFSVPDIHTIVIVIFNDVGKIVSPVKVTVYKETKQAQLSVIVVPVVFSMVAIVLIIFGVAYYFQSRTRFVVEVADFNFGMQATDMEYKTFRERLKDSFANAFVRAPTLSNASSEGESWWANNRKYGSMT